MTRDNNGFCKLLDLDKLKYINRGYVNKTYLDVSSTGVRIARTMAFLTAVITEVFRAYSVIILFYKNIFFRLDHGILYITI